MKLEVAAKNSRKKSSGQKSSRKKNKKKNWDFPATSQAYPVISCPIGVLFLTQSSP